MDEQVRLANVIEVIRTQGKHNLPAQNAYVQTYVLQKQIDDLHARIKLLEKKLA